MYVLLPTNLKKVCSKLSKTNTVYSIDLLGCGRSDRPAFTYTNFLYVELITNFIKHIIGEKTDVIVSGESCPFVLMACANDDSIINKVVMINPPNLVKMAKIPTKASKLFKKLIFTPVIGTFIYNLNVNKKTILQKFIFSYYYAQNDIKERDILTYFESSHKDHTHSKYLYACQKSRYLNAKYCSSVWKGSEQYLHLNIVTFDKHKDIWNAYGLYGMIQNKSEYPFL